MPLRSTMKPAWGARVENRSVRRVEEAGEKPITMNALAGQAGVSATTITRLGRGADDPKGASALTLDLAGKILTVLDCGIEDLLEVVEEDLAV